MNSRMNNLTNSEELLTEELARLKLKKPTIPKEYLTWWLQSFKNGDITDENYCKKLVNTFLAGVSVENDKSTVFLNITNDKEGSFDTLEVNLNEIETNPQMWSLCLPYLIIQVRN